MYVLCNVLCMMHIKIIYKNRNLKKDEIKMKRAPYLIFKIFYLTYSWHKIFSSLHPNELSCTPPQVSASPTLWRPLL